MSFIPFYFNLYVSLSCHTLSKALDMSRNTPLTSKPLSKEVKISLVIDRSWFLQESLGLNPDCFGEIRLLSKSILTCYCILYVRKSCYILEEERLNESFWCFVCRLFKKSVQGFLFSSHLEIFHILSIFDYFEKRFYYSVAGHFQHANTDHIMTMSFIRIEFTDDSFNIILHEFNVCQVLVDNGNSWWEENTVIFNNWALFYKKELKRSAFLLKYVTNLLSWKIGGIQRTFCHLT